MLFALGLGKSIVGDTVYCDYPPAAKAIAKIGDFNTNYEKVLALKPDLVIGDAVANARAITRLTQMHLPLLAIHATSLLTVEQSLSMLGQMTGTKRQAAFVVGQMEQKRRMAMAVAAHGSHPRVLLAIQTNPLWVAGEDTFMGDILRQAGGVNAAASVRGYGPYSKEALLANPPDLILGDASVQAAFRVDPAIESLPAVRAGHFFTIPSDLISRPGPRLADGLLLMARRLHSR